MKIGHKLTILAVSGALLCSTVFAEEKPVAKPAEAPKATVEKPAPDKKPAAKQTKTIRPTQSKDGY